MASGWLLVREPAPAPSRPYATVRLSTRPAHFWRTAGQALAIADRQPSSRSLLARYPHMRVTVFPGLNGQRDLGLWVVTYFPPESHQSKFFGSPGQLVRIADRSGIVLENSSQSWPIPWEVGNSNPTYRIRLELVSALLAVILLVLLWDTRRFATTRNLDLLALLSLGVSLAFYDRGFVLISVPLQYPPMLYLAGRLLYVGVRRARTRQWAPEPAEWASSRTLWMALGALVLARLLYNLLLGDTTDVSYASVLGANGIHHGWPLYWPGSDHMDAYGPTMYLSYLPFEFLFPDPDWLWNGLPAAHAAAITFDVLTVGGLIQLGRQLKPSEGGTRLGLILALAWTANPWTLQPIAESTNDGLVALMLVAVLLAASSPALRGSLLGWVVAAKFAPLALAGLFCFSTDRERRPRALILFGAALTLTTGVIVWAFLPPQGFGLFWSKTLGFQLSRHSFAGIWDQQPELEPLRLALEAAVAALSAGLLLWPRRRELYQVAALAGVIIIGLELSLRAWSYLYVDWYMPAVLVAVLGASAQVPVRATVRVRAADATPAPTPASA